MNQLQTNGLYGGMAVIAYSLILFLLNREYLVQPELTWASLIIYILFMVRAVQQERETYEESVFTMRAGTRTAFWVFLIISAVYYLFNYVMFNVIDPDLTNLQKQLLLDQEDFIRDLFGDEYFEAIRDKDFKITLSNSFFAFCQAAIGGFIISLLIGLTHRRG